MNESVNETQNNIVVDNNNSNIGKPKKKFNIRNILIIGICIILVLIIVFVVYSIFFTGSNSNKILVFKNKDNELKYIYNDNTDSILLSKSYEEKVNVKFNSKKDKLLYLKNQGLYLHNINSKTDSQKIGVDVKKYKFINNNEVIYLDINNNLYIVHSNGEREKLDVDVYNIIISKKNTLIYNKKEEVYLYNTSTKEKRAILKDYKIDNEIYVSNDLKQVLYISKNNELKIYNIDTKKVTTKDKDIYEIIQYDADDFSNIYYVKLGEKKKYYDEFINDNPQDNPIRKVQCTIYTFDQYIDPSTPIKNSDLKNGIYYLYDGIDGYAYYDEEGHWHFATVEMVDACNGKDPDSNLKEEIRNSDKIVQLYNLYQSQGDKVNEVSKDVYFIINSIYDTIVYMKTNVSDENKIKISSLTDISDLDTILDDIKLPLYYAKGDKKDNLLSNNYDSRFNDYVGINENKIYFYETNEKDETSFYEYNMKNDQKEKIGTNSLLLAVHNNGYDAIYLDNYNKETYKGDLVGRKGNSIINIDDDVYNYLDYSDKKLYYYKDYNFDTQNGTYIINNNNKKETINDISSVLRANNNNYYVLKDYSTTSKTYSLFIHNRGKEKAIEYNIIDYKYSW